MELSRSERDLELDDGVYSLPRMLSGCPLTSELVIELRPGNEREGVGVGPMEGVGVGLEDMQSVSRPEWSRYDSLLPRSSI